MDYKNTKLAMKIINQQLDDGSWGFFHSLSSDDNYKTEQALRKLQILGYTINDEVIKKAIYYLNECLIGNITIRDRVEKSKDWDIYVKLMISTWIMRFTLEYNNAYEYALKYKQIIESSFQSNEFSINDYSKAYEELFKIKNQRKNPLNIFYIVSILSKVLDDKFGEMFIRYILNSDSGIYYIYDKPLYILPKDFYSKDASRYLSAVELLLEYKHTRCLKQLYFIKDWLISYRSVDGTWDMGSNAKDNVYFPLSDSWNKECRIEDSTYRIKNIIKQINCD